LGGLLIQSENFQALSTLKHRYREQVKCIYIDPPFNLGQNADFLYKTDYKDSSWTTLLFNRLESALSMLQPNGMVYVRCDVNGNYLVRPILDGLLGKENFQAELLVQRIRKNVTSQGRISLPLANDSLFFYTRNPEAELSNPYVKLAETRESYWRRIDDSAGFRNPPERVMFGKTFLPYKHDAHFKYSQTSIEKMVEEKRIRLRCKNCSYAHYSGIWIKCESCGSEHAVPQYLVMEADKKILDTNWTDIAGYSHTTGFPTENSEVLLQRAFNVGSKTNELVMDFFAGSGTSLAVAMKSHRKWLGVEQGEQLDAYIIPRLKRSAHKENISHCFKLLKLESYEDTLNNLQLHQLAGRDDFFSILPQQATDNYLLHYMLDVESRSSLLSVDDFKKPFDYKMNIAVDSAGAYEPRKVDLVETFNYLIGLTVKRIDAQTERGFVAVSGTLPDGESCLVLWRDCEMLDYEGISKLCDELAINPTDNKFDVIYINGDHNIPTALTQTEEEGGATRIFKLRQIEPEFLARMFSAEDI
jgi:adenine-specific DNA-methyltransferase